MADYGSVNTYPATPQAETAETAMSMLGTLIDQMGSRRDYAAKLAEQTSHEANRAADEHRQLDAILESLVQVRQRFNETGTDTNRKEPRY